MSPAWLILGVIALGGSIFLLKWISGASPKAVWKFFRWVGLAIAVGIGVAFLFYGGFTLLWALPFLLPWLFRMRALRNWTRAAGRGPSEGRRSTVRTRFVVMELDHDSGRMDGTVARGPFSGRKLSDLEMAEAIALYGEALGKDARSAQVLQAYLDRTYGSAWHATAGEAGHARQENWGQEDPGWQENRGRGSHAGAAPPGGMDDREAREILGVGLEAGEAEIKAAHRRLIRSHHPDSGGSAWLAARINEAKDVLLGH